MKSKRTFATIVAAGALVSSVGACGFLEDRKSNRGRGDTGVVEVDGTEAWVIEMPDGFANIATKCIWEGVRAFSGTGSEGKGIAVLADPECEQPDYAGESR